MANWGVTTKRVFQHASCLRYLICVCISLKNKSRSTFNDRFIAAAMWRRRRRQRFIVFFVCFLRPFLPRFCAALCFVSNIGRSTLACRVYTRNLQRPSRAQSAVIYFAIAIKEPRCSARSRDLIACLFLSVYPKWHQDFTTFANCDWQITSRSSFALAFGFPSFLPSRESRR